MKAKTLHFAGFSGGRNRLGDETGVYHLQRVIDRSGFEVCVNACGSSAMTSGCTHRTVPSHGHLCGNCERIARKAMIPTRSHE